MSSSYDRVMTFTRPAKLARTMSSSSVEVAESSLDYDRQTKLPRYAASGIIEVWIVNLLERQIEVFRGPSGDGYTIWRTYRSGETIVPVAFPDVAFGVDEILG